MMDEKASTINEKERYFSAIRYRSLPTLGVRYVSGSTVFDEMLAGGRLVSRYWNPNGQVLPEMYYEKLSWSVGQPADTFQLSIDNRNLAGGYAWDSASQSPDSSHLPLTPPPTPAPPCREGLGVGREGQGGVRKDSNNQPFLVTHGVVSLKHADAGIAVKVHTRLDGSPFLIRWLEITNLNSHAVGVTAVSPFSGLLWSHRYEEHLPPQLESPFELAYTHQFEWGHEGDFWFEPLVAGRKIIDGEKKGRSGWGRPAFWVKNVCNGQTFVCELAWGGNYEFELDCRLQGTSWVGNQVQPGNRQAELYFRMGLSGHDPVLRVLDAGETIQTPSVHLGLFHSNFDEIVQATHNHVRQVVMPAQVPGREVEIEANHRGYLCDRENVPDIIKDVDVAASLGVEMYVIDAGWYGNEPNQWWNNTGDWQDGAWLAKDGGLRAIVDHVHDLGLKFGLWVEIEAAGVNSTLKQDHPDWLLKRNQELVAGGRALDLTQPVVATWVESEIERLILTYHLDMFRIDHNHNLQPSGNRLNQGLIEDLTWRYYEALFGIFDRLRERFPQVVFQNCAGGGGRLDWGTLGRFHNSELSDWMRPPRGIKILNGVTTSLPPEILLRTFGTEVGEHVLDGDVDTQLRHCFSRIIFRGIAPSIDELTPYLRAHIEHYLDLYKTFIRPVMLGSLVFHHTPGLSLAQTTPWCVLEYGQPDRKAAVAVVFRTSATAEGVLPDVYTFYPRGLSPDRLYRVRLDNSRQEFITSGSELANRGLNVRLEAALSSELLMFEEVKKLNTRFAVV